MNWKRIAAFAIALLLMPSVMAWIQQLVLSVSWGMFAPTHEEAVALARPVRRVVIVLLGFLAYLVFLRGLSARLLDHAVALFVSVSILLVGVEAALTASLSESIDVRYVGVHVIVALAALAVAAAWRRLRPPARRAAARR